MSARMRSIVEAVALVGLAAGLGYGATYATKHYAPVLWFAWLGSGAAIAFGLSRWQPRYWVAVGVATPSLVLAETIWKLPGAPPTAAALGLGFGVFWALTSLAGAALGRPAADGTSRAGA
jgi:hypothetical protein